MAMDQLWAEQTVESDAVCRRGVPLPALRLLVIASPAMNDADLVPLVEGGAARLLGQVSMADAVQRLEQIARADAVWLFADADGTNSGWEALAHALNARDCALICEAPSNRIDDLYGIFSGLSQAVFLRRAQPLDRQIALATISTGRAGLVRDVAADATQARIDQLQEEVARIARLLDQLSRQGGELHAPLFPQLTEPDGYSASVRSPTRSFTAEAGPRSFERALSPERQRARQIRQMIRRRRMREQFFPADMFADPAWDMLLDIYAAGLEGQPVSVSSLCIAAAVPATTALRWIKTMTDAGIFERQADPRDGRRVFIAMCAKTEEAMARYFEALAEQ